MVFQNPVYISLRDDFVVLWFPFSLHSFLFSLSVVTIDEYGLDYGRAKLKRDILSFLHAVWKMFYPTTRSMLQTLWLGVAVDLGMIPASRHLGTLATLAHSLERRS